MRETPIIKRLCDNKNVKGFTEGLYCEIAGKGPPLLLINGGPGATHHYFHPAFDKAESFCKVIYYDQAGCGFSRRDGNYSLNNSLDDIEKLRQNLNIQKWLVLGHSYGGLLAQLYALRNPERLCGLILCCTTPGIEVDLNTATEKDEILTAGEIQAVNEIKKSSLPENEKYFRILMAGNWKKHYFKRPSNGRLAEIAFYDYDSDPEFVKRLDKEMQAADLRNRFDKMRIPTLLMESENDLVWKRSKIEKLRRNHSYAAFVLFRESRHYPFEDEPEVFFKTLKTFIKKIKMQESNE